MSAVGLGLPVDAAVNGGASYAKQLREFRDRVCACLVHLEEVPLLGATELWLPAAEVAFGLGDLHPFARASSNEVGLELGHHREDVEQQPADRIVGVVNGTADVELDVLRGQLVDDVLRVSKASCEPVELRDDKCVPVATRRERFTETRARPVRAGQAVIGVDVGGRTPSRSSATRLAVRSCS